MEAIDRDNLLRIDAALNTPEQFIRQKEADELIRAAKEDDLIGSMERALDALPAEEQERLRAEIVWPSLQPPTR